MRRLADGRAGFLRALVEFHGALLQRDRKIVCRVRELLELCDLLLFVGIFLLLGLLRVVARLGLGRGRENECREAHLALFRRLQEILFVLVALLDLILGHLLRGAKIVRLQRDIRCLGRESRTDELGLDLGRHGRDRRGEQRGDFASLHLRGHEEIDLRLVESLGVQHLLRDGLEAVAVELPILPHECARLPELLLDFLLRCGDAERRGLTIEQQRIFHALGRDLSHERARIHELRIRIAEARMDAEHTAFVVKRLLRHGLAAEDHGGAAVPSFAVHARPPSREGDDDKHGEEDHERLAESAEGIDHCF